MLHLIRKRVLETNEPLDNAFTIDNNNEDADNIEIQYQRQDGLRCSNCNQLLEDDGIPRKRKKMRKCDRCTRAIRARRRKETPCSLLRSKWYCATSKKYPLISPDLRLMDTVEFVWNRWEGKSVISGIANASLLCITPYKLFDSGRDITRNDLVLVTSAEAQMLAKISDQNVRIAKFPPEVRAKINNV